MTVRFERLLQVAGTYRLGRHVLHDERSKDFDARILIRPRPLVDTVHEGLCPPWDQGQVGSCTANAALGCLMTKPLWNGSWKFTEVDAQELYRQETRVDDAQIPGHWEPTDTGSTGLWSMKVLRRAGYIREYRHAFRLSTVLHLLLDRPVSTGVTWYNSMFEVDNEHVIQVDPDSGVAGGHQICLVGLDATRNYVRVRNSWGTGWADGGYAWLSFEAYDHLLHEQGDAVVPVV